MNKHSKIETALELVPFAETYISSLNPRTVIDETEVLRLKDNIATYGLIQNLAGIRDSDGRIGIVAGGRRHRALALLQDDARFKTVAVRIAPDKEAARAWAASENNLREAMHPADEIQEFGTMAEQGAKVPAIALAFGVSEQHVYRRLALAKLPSEVLEALRADEITLAAASSFTTSNDVQTSLDVLEYVRGHDHSASWIKQRLNPSSVTSTDRRAKIVGQEAYKATGGTLMQDLFAEEVIFLDVEILQGAFVAELERQCEALKEAMGWKWVELSDEAYLPWNFREERNLRRVYRVEGVLSDTELQRCEELLEQSGTIGLNEAEAQELLTLQTIAEGAFTDHQKAISGAILYLDHQGQLRVEEGLVTPEDQAEAVSLGLLEPVHHNGSPEIVRSPISDKLRRDLNCIETGARQTSALSDPKLLLHLLAFQLSGKMRYRSAFGLEPKDVFNSPSSETGYDLNHILTDETDFPDDPWNCDLKREFAVFQKQGDKAIMDLLNQCLAGQLNISEEGLGSLIDKKVKRRTRDVFTPNAENFFGRVTASYLQDLFADLLDLKASSTTMKSFAKLKKAEKASLMEKLFINKQTQITIKVTEAQLKRINDWLPEGMI